MIEKYISESKLKAHYSWLGKDATLSPKDVDDIVDAQPAADVEPVVRCPECVNGQRVNNVWTRCAKDGTRRLDSFYCAHGKERDAANERVTDYELSSRGF